jgi:hypothetical protein
MYVKEQPWYGANVGYEGTVLFVQSTFHYITEAVVFSAGFPYRKSIYNNKLFTIYILLATAFNLIIACTRIQPLNVFLSLKIIPDFKFNLLIVQLAVIHFFVSFLFETFLFDKEFKINFNGKKS